MGFLATLTNQLGILLKSQSAARRVMLLGVAMASLGGLGWMIYQAQTGGYTVLIQNLRPADGVEAMAKLQQLGIKARMESGGTTIQVPQTRFDDAIMMLSIEGIPSSGTVGYELMDKSSLGQSKFQQEKNYLRMREGELARTLLSLREVEKAKVHLALPEDSVFIKDEKAATASVVLKLHAGNKLEERQINGIVNLVSHGIEGLKPENVSIIDDNGNLINQARNDDASQSTEAQQNYKIKYEDLLKSRIESQLENIVGRGKVAARVQADFNFSTQHQISQRYNPDEQNPILKMEKAVSESLAGKAAAGGPTGAPGSSSNLPATLSGGAGANTTTSATAAGDAGTSKTDRTAEYAVSSTWDETQQTVPTPKKVSVAVLVDWAEDKDTAGKVTPRVRTPEEITAIEDLVKAAIGFTANETREDQIKVMCERFKTDAPDTAKESWFNSYPVRLMIQLGVQWGIVGLIGLLLILMVLRPALKQIMVTPMGSALQALPAGAGGLMGQISAETMQSLPPEVQAALANNQARGGQKGIEAMGRLEDAPLDEVEEEEIPEELRDNKEAIKHFRLQRLAAKQARLTQAEAQKIHQEVLETAKSNPQKTVSLMRQWMDEA